MQKTKDIPAPALGVVFKLRRSVASALGVVSRLRRAKSKAPALQNIRCKAGALLLTRRSVDATPSGQACRDAMHCVSTMQRRAESPAIISTGQRPVWKGHSPINKPQRGGIKSNNRISPLQGFSRKSRRDGTLLTVGEAEGVTCGSNNCYILFISHL
jgi:hypothetical protein